MSKASTVALAMMLLSCAPSQSERLVGEYGLRDGAYFFRDCASGVVSSATMRSEAAVPYLRMADDLGAKPEDTLILEVEAIPLGTSSGRQHYGIGRVFSVRRGTCSAV
jgi:hypothetical protein